MNLKEKIIITGGSGFLAKNLLNHIDKNKFEIILLTRSKKKKDQLETIYKKAKTDLIDWNNQIDVNEKLKEASYIIHTAAKVPTRSESNNYDIIKSSLKIAKRIVSANLNLKKLIFISTLRTCIDSNKKIMSDDTKYNFYKFDTAYGKSKFLTELYFKKYKNIIKYPVITCSPGHILGPDSPKISKSNEFIFNIFKKKVCFYTKTNYAIVDILDVCKSIILLLDSSNSSEKYLLCKKNPSMLDLIDMCEQIQNKKKIKIYLPLFLINFVSYIFEFFNNKFKIKNMPINRSSYYFAKLNCSFEGTKIENKGLEYTDLNKTINNLYNYYNDQ